MGTTWERLSGDTSCFAVKLAFSDDPDPGFGGSQAVDASWGSLQIWVNQRNICANQVNDERAEAVHWYLLPFIDWWVSNWDAIFHEERLPNQNAGTTASEALFRTRIPPVRTEEEEAYEWEEQWHAWWTRHSLEAARTGGLVPSVSFRRWRDRLEIAWDEEQGTGLPEGLVFTQPSGAARLDPAKVAEPLYTVSREAVAFLLERCPDSEHLAALSSAIEGIRSARPQRLAWLLGLGRNLEEMTTGLEELVERVRGWNPATVSELLGSPDDGALFARPLPAALMFGATSPSLSTGDRVSLLREMWEARCEEPPDLPAECPEVDRNFAAEQGRDLAEGILAELGLDADSPEPVDVERVLQELSINVREIDLDDQSVRAVAIAGPRFQPTIVINRRHKTNDYPSGRRFSLAHELCHVVFDRDYAREVALPSGPWAPREIEQRANGFAATILLPPTRLRAAIRGAGQELSTVHFVAELAERFGASFTAVLSQLHSLGYIDAEERESLRDAALDQTSRRDDRRS